MQRSVEKTNCVQFHFSSGFLKGDSLHASIIKTRFLPVRGTDV